MVEKNFAITTLPIYVWRTATPVALIKASCAILSDTGVTAKLDPNATANGRSATMEGKVIRFQLAVFFAIMPTVVVAQVVGSDPSGVAFYQPSADNLQKLMENGKTVGLSEMQYGNVSDALRMPPGFRPEDGTLPAHPSRPSVDPGMPESPSNRESLSSGPQRPEPGIGGGGGGTSGGGASGSQSHGGPGDVIGELPHVGPRLGGLVEPGTIESPGAQDFFGRSGNRFSVPEIPFSPPSISLIDEARLRATLSGLLMPLPNTSGAGGVSRESPNLGPIDSGGVVVGH